MTTRITIQQQLALANSRRLASSLRVVAGFHFDEAEAEREKRENERKAAEAEKEQLKEATQSGADKQKGGRL